MKKKSILTALGLMALSAILFFPQQEYNLKISGGMPAVPLGIPQFVTKGTSPEIKAAAVTLNEVFEADMTYSRVFQPLKKSYYGYIRPLDPENIHYKDWQSIGAKLLVVGEVAELQNGFEFIFTLYDVRSERYVSRKRYTGEYDVVRLAAHRASNSMMELYGEPPIFTTKIVFVSNRDGNDELYMMDYDGRNQTRLTFNRVKDYMPAISPDGKSIAYTSYRGTKAALYVFNPYEGTHVEVHGGGTNWAPCFSPDGRRLAFSSTVDQGNSELYVANSDGSRPRRITYNRSADTAPCWSPNSRQIAFTSDRGGTPHIYIMDAQGGNPRRVSFSGSYHDAPAWSPDGDRIAYVSRVDQIFDIYVLNIRTEQIVKFTESFARNEYPNWSPDGRHIIFTSDRTRKVQIYTMDYDGRNLKQLTFTGDNKLPDWSKE